MKTLVSEITTRVVDHNTGEVKQETTETKHQVPVEPPFVKVYVTDLCALKGAGVAEGNLLRLLLARLDYDGYVSLTPRIRGVLCEQLGITPKTLRNRLNALVRAEFMQPANRNEYRMNPTYFARGNWKSILEQRRSYQMIVTYGADGSRTLSTQDTAERDPRIPDLLDQVG